jgi:hypothetical protein
MAKEPLEHVVHSLVLLRTRMNSTAQLKLSLRPKNNADNQRSDGSFVVTLLLAQAHTTLWRKKKV